MTRLQSRFRGAFLGGMLGDAFGRVLEGASARDLRASLAVERRAASTDGWAYSDDTEMMLGVAVSLRERGAVDPEHLLSTLAHGCEPARGYGGGTRRVFAALDRGVRWQDAAFAAWAEGSRGNGAAVRVVPIACRYHDDRDRRVAGADASARVTHAHPVARHGCVLHAEALAAVLALDAPADFDAAVFVRRLIASLPPEAAGFDAKLARVGALLGDETALDEVVGVLGNGVTADVSVPLALYGFARWAPRFEDVVMNLARCGGDVDTIGAMGGALAGALVGEEGLPRAWIDRLEAGPRGRDGVRQLADDLFAQCTNR